MLLMLQGLGDPLSTKAAVTRRHAQVTFSTRRSLTTAAMLIVAAVGLQAAYKVRPWRPLPIESYPAKLSSEGITIAVDPLYTNQMAAKVFDNSEILTRGIMPLAVIICNSNNFAVEVDGRAVELVLREDRLRSLDPLQAVQQIYSKKGVRTVAVPSPIPLPRIKLQSGNKDAAQDFTQKSLTALSKIYPHSTAGGFVYVAVPPPPFRLPQDLVSAKVYIPKLFRGDNGADLLYFEIDLTPALGTAAGK